VVRLVQVEADGFHVYLKVAKVIMMKRWNPFSQRKKQVVVLLKRHKKMTLKEKGRVKQTALSTKSASEISSVSYQQNK